VDQAIQELNPQLQAGDVIINGGNLYYSVDQSTASGYSSANSIDSSICSTA
jgi:6-phosphogluconate dehydrogenase (decarboxylating)